MQVVNGMTATDAIHNYIDCYCYDMEIPQTDSESSNAHCTSRTNQIVFKQTSITHRE